MNNLAKYLLSKHACMQVKGGGTRALEEEFGVIILNNGQQVTIGRLEEEFGIEITNMQDLLRAIARANNLLQH